MSSKKQRVLRTSSHQQHPTITNTKRKHKLLDPYRGSSVCLLTREGKHIFDIAVIQVTTKHTSVQGLAACEPWVLEKRGVQPRASLSEGEAVIRHSVSSPSGDRLRDELLLTDTVSVLRSNLDPVSRLDSLVHE